MRITLAELHASIDALLAAYPELAEDEALRADMFEAETTLHEALEIVVGKAQEAKCMGEAIGLRMDSLSERKARYSQQETAFRSLIQSLMEKADLTKIVLPEATLSVSVRAPSPVVEDADALPEHCVRLKRSPDMAAIKDALKDGDVPGVRMSNGRSVLTIRVK